MTRADAVAVVQGTIAALSKTGITISPDDETAAIEAATAFAANSPGNDTAIVEAIRATLAPAVQARKTRQTAFDAQQAATAARVAKIASTVTLVIDKINAASVQR